MINLHLGDSLAAMRAMDDNTYDLAIVDPPYGMPKQCWRGGSNTGNGKLGNRAFFAHHGKGEGWDIAPTPEYFDQLRRISRNQIIWGGNYFPVNCYRCFIVWDKMTYVPTMSQVELAVTSFNSPARYVKINSTDPNRMHPTQKPVALYQWILDNYATEGDRIIDTHLGSGSIAIACYNSGYALDAWEIDPEYHANAVARYQAHTRQLKLF